MAPCNFQGGRFHHLKPFSNVQADRMGSTRWNCFVVKNAPSQSPKIVLRLPSGGMPDETTARERNRCSQEAPCGIEERWSMPKVCDHLPRVIVLEQLRGSAVCMAGTKSCPTRLPAKLSRGLLLVDANRRHLRVRVSTYRD